ncbi:MAG: metallophosphoesterase [Candidatus Sulfotelmatobacter sp.]|jgi:UDP-2,3-diacylglucosamine pyrophosphatase LpxH
MHVFVSDLHMTDTGAGGAVTDGQLETFVNHLEKLAGERKDPIKLILLGDIFDLLRSPQWTILWNEKKSAPWSAVSKNFKHFKNSPAEQTAIEVASKIASQYPDFSASLCRLVQQKKIETLYIPGNHDFMMQLSPQLREIMVKFAALQHDVKKQFKLTYSDKEAEVYATHGNYHDPVNSHIAADGHWAMGDAVVLRIVNRFAEEACRALGCNLTQPIGLLLQEIDNIEPLSDIPLYVRWLVDENLVVKSSRDEVLKVWSDIVDDFLRLKDFREGGYKAKPYQMVRLGFELSKQMKLARLTTELAKQFPDAGIDYREAARNELGKNSAYRFVVFGHTHKPMMEPLTSAPEEQVAFYVNTGCWRRLVTRPHGKSAGLFAGRRVASYFVIDDSTGNPAQERFHLLQEWHAS